MTSDTSCQHAVAEEVHSVCTQQDNSQQGNVVITPSEQNAPTIDEQRPYSDTEDDSVKKHPLLRWWQKLKTNIVLAYSCLLVFPMITFVLLCIAGSDQNQRQNSSEEADTDLLPFSPNQVQPARRSVRSSTLISRKLFKFLRSTSYRLAPYCLCALFAWLIIKAKRRPLKDTEACNIRQNDNGFKGNADFYGLGVRLGLYLQWTAATFAAKFVPSTFRFIHGSYLFVQLGILVAVCLLVLPGSCTFIAEFPIVFQLLWSGGALALRPFQAFRTKFDPASPNLTLEIMSAIMGLCVFIVASSFSIRLYFHPDDFMDTPGGTYIISFFEFGPGAIDSFWILRLAYTVVLLTDLFVLLRKMEKAYVFSEFVHWTNSVSANMATGGLVAVCNFVVKAMVFVLVEIELIVTLLGTRKETSSNGYDVAVFKSRFGRFFHRITTHWSVLLCLSAFSTYRKSILLTDLL